MFEGGRQAPAKVADLAAASPAGVTEQRALMRTLVRDASASYRGSGHFAWRFARGKLRLDPVFAGLLEHGLVPSNARLLDLGCGQGLLAAWLAAARSAWSRGEWPAHWPVPPELRSFHGIEWMPRDVARARRALADAQITCADISESAYGEADVIAIIDVLHYLDRNRQERVLTAVRAALGPGGVVLLRVGDAAAGIRFRLSRWVDSIVISFRGLGWRRLHCRPVQEWECTLQQLGFETETWPMSQGTPFANVLLVGRVPD